jgi:hypothetical protein
VSNRAYCPACQAETSTILGAFQRGEDCPSCGLSAAAAGELLDLQRRGAEWDTVDRAAKAELRAEAAEREAARLRWRLRFIRQAVAEADGPAPVESRLRGWV